MFTIELQQYQKEVSSIEIKNEKYWYDTAEKFGNLLYNDEKMEQGYYDALLFDENHILLDHVILLAYTVNLAELRRQAAVIKEMTLL